MKKNIIGMAALAMASTNGLVGCNNNSSSYEFDIACMEKYGETIPAPSEVGSNKYNTSLNRGSLRGCVRKKGSDEPYYMASYPDGSSYVKEKPIGPAFDHLIEGVEARPGDFGEPTHLRYDWSFNACKRVSGVGDARSEEYQMCAEARLMKLHP